MTFLRSLLFNILFFGSTALICILYIPTLLLPRPIFMKFIIFYYQWVAFLEKYIIGLTYEVKGIENLPKDGAFLVGMKHQSAYETMKLHLLFNDPAIILKRELLRIPIWGWLAAKCEMIGIDRQKGKSSLQVMVERTRPVIERGRPVVIFPQGTRVPIGQSKPYKKGIVKLAESFDLPIVPVAMNSGLFWPKKSFIKRSGKVTFNILPPIQCQEKTVDTLKQLQTIIETESDKLIR